MVVLRKVLEVGFALAVWAGLTASIARAQVICADLWALPGYSKAQCDTALKAFEGVKHPCLRTIWKAFGEAGYCEKKFLEQSKDRPHTLAFFVSNETCHRNGRHCTKHDTPSWRLKLDRKTQLLTIPGTGPVLDAYQKRAREISRFITRWGNANTSGMIITGLEDDYSESTFRRIAGRINRGAPELVTARNPMRYRSTAGGGRVDLIELHTFTDFKPGACIFSNDGFDAFLSSARRTDYDQLGSADLRAVINVFATECSHVGIWWNAQGIGEPGSRFVEPRKRRIRIYREDVTEVNRLIKRYEGR